METMHSKAELIRDICNLLLSDKKSDAAAYAQKHLPFVVAPNIGINEYERLVTYASNRNTPYIDNSSNKLGQGSRKYLRETILKVFHRDGFIDRYTGVKLLHPGLLTLLHIELPEIFKYNGGWKLENCHIIFWELFPTVDHIVPITKGGSDDVCNLLTISMIGNTRKKNETLENLRWKILPQGNIRDWDGLTDIFLKLMEKNDNYESYGNIPALQIQHRKLLHWWSVSKKVLNRSLDRKDIVTSHRNGDSTIHELAKKQIDKFRTSTYSSNYENIPITFEELPIGHLFTYGGAKTIYRKLTPIWNALGRVINLCRPKSDHQREWSLNKPSELLRIVRPVNETEDEIAKLFL